MKAVLISIRPKWVEKIVKGEKTIEVRKTRPKLETPFKVYIYVTKEKSIYDMLLISNEKGFGKSVVFGDYRNHGFGWEIGNCKVIGEFVCDEITPLFNVATTSWDLLSGNIHEYAKGLVRMARLTEKEMHSYANGKNCFAWHITDLKIYDKPKELGEFRTPEWFRDCKKSCDAMERMRCPTKDSHKVDKMCGWCRGGGNPITRPPQSWCYVEVIE